jgi:hypothetical protein
VIVLRSTGVLARLDPLHGGEVLDLVDLATGRQLLGRPPFPSLERLPGPLDEDRWTNGYRGGWQIATPNAGNACSVGDEEHGFHGAASSDPWEVVAVDAAAATLRWRGHGLEITRRYAAEGTALTAETEWLGLRDGATFVAVEHIAFGVELIVPGAMLCVPGGRAYELSETTGPVRGPAEARDWPDVLLLDGSSERGDRLEAKPRNGRFFAVEALPEGWYELVNAHTGQGVRVEWDSAVLPHLWIWRELGASGGRWRRRAEIVGIEPASVPHSLGLARALDEHQAFDLARGERLAGRVLVRPFARAERA